MWAAVWAGTPASRLRLSRALGKGRKTISDFRRMNRKTYTHERARPREPIDKNEPMSGGEPVYRDEPNYNEPAGRTKPDYGERLAYGGKPPRQPRRPNPPRPFAATSRYGGWVIPVFIFAISLGFSVLFYFLAVAPHASKVLEQGQVGTTNTAASTPFANGVSVTQTFDFGARLSGFSILFGTYGEMLENVNFTFGVYDGQATTQLLTFTATTNVEDNKSITFRLPEPVEAASGTYWVSFIVSGVPEGKQLSVWLGDNETYRCSVDGVQQANSMLMRLFTEDSGFLARYYWGVAALLCLFLPAAWYCVFVLRARLEKVFLLAAFVLGAMYMLVYPPYAAFDSSTHIPMTFAHSSALLGEETRFGAFTTSWTQRAEDGMEGFSASLPGYAQYYHISENFFKMAADPDARVEMQANSIGYAYQYFPQTLGVTLARLLHFGQVPTLFLGELFSLAAYIAIVFFAIKLSPFKPLYFLLGTAPMMLVTAGSFSYDTPINALCLFFTACVFHLAYVKPRIGIVDVLLLVASGALLAPMKLIYIPLLLLPLIIPAEKWGGKWRKKVVMIVVLAAAVFCVVYLAGNILSKSFGGKTFESPWLEAGGTYSHALLFSDPAEYFRILLFSFIDNVAQVVDGIGMVQSFTIPTWITLSLVAMMVLSVAPVTGGMNGIEVRKWQKPLLAMCYFLVFGAGIMAALIWTSAGAYYVKGSQGRYYMPVMMLLVLLTQGVISRRKNNDRGMVFAGCAMGAYAVYYLFGRVALGGV